MQHCGRVTARDTHSPGSTPAAQTTQKKHTQFTGAELSTGLSRSLTWAHVTLAPHGLLTE